MRSILMSLLWTAFPPLVSAVIAEEVQPTQDANRLVTVNTFVVGGAGDDETPADGEGARAIAITVNANGAVGNDGSSNRKVVALARVNADPEGSRNRAWLGVAFSSVPEALAAQLGTEGKGLMILNVTKDSPADLAGLQAHDVMISIAGQEVDGDLAHLVDMLKERQPGETVDLVVLQQGQQKTLKVQLGTRPEAQAFAWKFDTGPVGEIREQTRTKGSMIQRGPNGEWTVKNLGDLSAIPGLPDNIRTMVPQSGTQSTRVFTKEGRQTISTRTETHGDNSSTTTIAIEQPEGGDITVTRSGDNGQESTATYATEDELRAADAEAHALYSNASAQATTIHLNVDGGNGMEDLNFDFDLDVGDLHEHLAELHQHLQQGMGQAYGSAMEELNKALEELKSGQGANLGERLSNLHSLFSQGDGDGPGRGNGPSAHAFMFHGKARQTFEVKPDGKIEVRVRKGDSELVTVYDNEADLQRRDPVLYEKYQNLTAGDE